MTKTIDLNCDLGESYGNFKIGNDARLLPYLTSCNIACGFHGGDPLHIEKTVKNALELGVQIGAHPSYPDLQGFGRRLMQIPPDELRAIIKYQIAALKGIVESLGGKLAYVKPHGALYNQAARDTLTGESILQAIQETGSDLALMGLAGSSLKQQAAQAGIRFVAEGFADRRYTAQGQLQSRNIPGAVLHQPEQVVQQVLQMVLHKEVTTASGTTIPIAVQSICIHGDNPAAAAILQALDAAFAKNGVKKQRF